jgi:hypothetical protein
MQVVLLAIDSCLKHMSHAEAIMILFTGDLRPLSSVSSARSKKGICVHSPLLVDPTLTTDKVSTMQVIPGHLAFDQRAYGAISDLDMGRNVSLGSERLALFKLNPPMPLVVEETDASAVLTAWYESQDLLATRELAFKLSNVALLLGLAYAKGQHTQTIFQEQIDAIITLPPTDQMSNKIPREHGLREWFIVLVEFSEIKSQCIRIYHMDLQEPMFLNAVYWHLNSGLDIRILQSCPCIACLLQTVAMVRSVEDLRSAFTRFGGEDGEATLMTTEERTKSVAQFPAQPAQITEYNYTAEFKQSGWTGLLENKRTPRSRIVPTRYDDAEVADIRVSDKRKLAQEERRA